MDFLSAGEAVEPRAEQVVCEFPPIRKISKDSTWLGPKESAVRQHRQEMKTKMKTNKVEEAKPARPKQVRPSKDIRHVFHHSFSPVDGFVCYFVPVLLLRV